MRPRLPLLVLAPLAVWILYLSLLPVFPSQDGPSHLLTGRILFDLFQGTGGAQAFYVWRAGQWTNQLCTFVLGGLQSLGLSPGLSEGLFQCGVLALFLLAGGSLLRRAGAAPEAGLLLLLPFMGRVLHLGFYNFLASLALGLAAWTSRRPGFWSPLSDLCFLFSLYAHPLGPLAYLGLRLFDLCAGRRFRELPVLIPHALLFVLAARENLGGSILPGPGAAPDLLGAQWTLVRGGEWVLVRVLLLLLLVARLFRTWSDLPAPARRTRIRLFLLAILPMLATGLFPDLSEEAIGFRARAAVFAWVLLLCALAPAGGGGLGLLRPAAVACVLILVAGNFRRDLALSRDQRDQLRSWPAVPAGSTVLAGFDLYDPESWLLQAGYVAVPPRTYRPRSLARTQGPLTFNPWIHLPDRWILERGALAVADHQSFFPQSPLAHRNPPDRSWRSALAFKGGHLPLEECAGAAERIFLANLPPAWFEAARLRLPPTLTVEAKGPDWILLRSEASPPERRLESPFFTKPLTKLPLPLPVPRTFGGGKLGAPGPVAAGNALFPFRAFVSDERTRTFRAATARDLDPPEGVWNREGAFRFRSARPPAAGELWILPR